MGAISAVVSSAPVAERESRLRATEKRSPYHGLMQTWHFDGGSFGLQARHSEATFDETDTRLVLVCGRPYALQSDDPAAPGGQGASVIGRIWDEVGPRASECLDGEYAFLLYDKLARATFACVSLLMTRQLYHATGRIAGEPCVVLASEMRQAAVGAGIEMRLDTEQLVQHLCLNAPTLDRRRTEYRGIDRLLAPGLFRLDSAHLSPRQILTYWSPPEQRILDSGARAALPDQVYACLSTALRAAPLESGLSLSGGYDSGLLWAIAYAERARRPMPLALSRSLKGIANDETTIIAELLRLTGQTADFMDVLRIEEDEAAFSRALGLMDRLPLTMGCSIAEQFPKRMRAAGVHSHISGSGAEASLTGYPNYIAEQLRAGRWLAALRDLLRIESYYRESKGVYNRLRLLWFHGLAPRGSRLRTLIRERPPFPVRKSWWPLLDAAEHAATADRRRYGLARGAQIESVRFYTLVSGIEGQQQINEHHGVEMQMPFLHRRVIDLGLSLNLRDLACGIHDKELMRKVAVNALDADPPWPRSKLVPGISTGDGQRALVRLGAPASWRLVTSGVLDRDRTTALQALAARGHAWGGPCARLVALERFLRRTDT